MKSFLFLLATTISLLTAQAQAITIPIISCKAVSIVDDSKGIGKSLKENPEVSVAAAGDNYQIYIGSTLFENAVVTSNPGDDLDYKFEVQAKKGPRFEVHQPFCEDQGCQGTLKLITEIGKTLISNLDCK